MFFGTAALLFLLFYEPPNALSAGPFGRVSPLGLPVARPAPDAFGRSGGVSMRFALPNDTVEFPLEVAGDPAEILYQWVSLADLTSVDSLRPLRGAYLRAPGTPGFYRLVLARGADARVLADLTLAVKVPFSEKKGATLNGYRIGTYVAEQKGAASSERPDGFIQVSDNDMALALSRHFTVADFVTHDNQKVWPRYSAVDPRILDKVELVLAEVDKLRKAAPSVKLDVAQFALDVHSAFRTPLYNRAQSRARESRHQYGDAVDFSIDADGDGRVNSRDIRLITQAVDSVEKYHPDLVGGLGVYGGLGRGPYVHIDARGSKVRWRG
jgi:hypothetical protein